MVGSCLHLILGVFGYECSHYFSPHVDRVNRKWPCSNHCICPSASGQFGPIHVSVSKLHS